LDRQRIDKWLWHARLVRTRKAAAALADSGQVRVNGVRIDSASRRVMAGDVLTVALGRIRVLKVLGFSERRGGANAAAALFLDLDPQSPASAAEVIVPEPAAACGPIAPEGRPDKRDRRLLARLKRDFGA
jgi:ribosome-associated heat shock protein Hsp15